MEFFTRFYFQLQGIYRSMTPGSRRTAGALGVVVLLGLGYLGLHRNDQLLVDLTNGAPLSAGQLSAVKEAFDKANLKGYEIQGNTIRVPSDRQAAFHSALADAKVLTQDFGDAQLDALNSGSFLQIGSERDQELMRIAKQNKLQQMICMRPGIAYAKVIFDIDKKPGGFKEKALTALVSVKRGDGSQIDEATISAINGMVVHAYAGLKPENVAVSDLNGRTWYGDPTKNGSSEGNAYVSLKRTCEQDLKVKILDALCYIPNVTVGVNVELENKLPPVVKRIQQNAAAADVRIENGDPMCSGSLDNMTAPLDAASQQPNMAKVMDTLLGDSPCKTNFTHPARGGNVAQQKAEPEVLSLAPISARVSVGVPASYFKTVWQRLNPVEPGKTEKTPDQVELDRIRIEESANIQRCIAPLLPPPKNPAEAAELVTVTVFQDPSVQEPPPPEMGRIALNWLSQNGNAFALIGLGLLCLLVIRSIVRGWASASMKSAEPSKSPDTEIDDDLATDRRGDIPDAHWNREDRSEGTLLREELSDFVEEDPEAAAHILRNWIGQTS
jgi:flagellar M-ring protein FliF